MFQKYAKTCKNMRIHFIVRPLKFKQQFYSKEMLALRIGDIRMNLKSLLLLVKHTSFCFLMPTLLKELAQNFSGKLKGHAGEPMH